MIGSVIGGHYLVKERLGEGGMGEVFLVEDQKLHRRAALKLIRAELTRDPVRRQRFLQEATLAASIDHPHICAIYDIDEADGRTFIAMEYVEGHSLRDLLRQGPLLMQRSLDLALQVAEALAKVHERGVVHRDLKPDNVLVSADGYAKVIDFGIAKLVHPLARAGVSDAATLTEVHIRTADGMVLGTMGYMSPEQVRGEPVDARSDIFSFGALLYEMVGGTAPFKRTSPAETMSAILTALVTPVHIPDTQVEPDLQRILRKCLVKEAAGRYQTMRDVAVDLRDVRAQLTSGETAARPSTAVTNAPTAAARSGRALIGAATLVAVVAVASGVPWMRRGPVETALVSEGTPVRPSVAVLAFEVISGGADIAWLGRGLPSLLTTGLAQTPAIEVVGPERLSDAARTTGAASIDKVDRSQHADLARRAGARFIVNGTIAQSGTNLRIDARVEDLTSGAVRVAANVVGTDPFLLADALSTRILAELNVQAPDVRKVAEVTSSSPDAYRNYIAGVEAQRSFRRADARRFLEAAVTQDAGFALAHLELSWLEGAVGDENARRASLAEAAKHVDRISERDGLGIRAEVAISEMRIDEAERLLESLIDKYPDTEAAYLQLFRIFDVFGPRPNSARFIAIVTRGIRALPYSFALRNSLGYGLYYDGQTDAAIRELTTQLKMRPNESNPFDSLAEAYLATGQTDQAIKFFTQAAAISGSAQRTGRAWSYAVLGNYDDALNDLPQPIFIRRAILTRLGRYRESERDIAEAKQAHQFAGDVRNLAGLSLLQALSGFERGACDQTARYVAEAELAMAGRHQELQRPFRVIGLVLVGACEARGQKLSQARASLDRARHLQYETSPIERWWVRALEGEIALAVGDSAGAAQAFAAGVGPHRMVFNKFLTAAPLSFFANNLIMRDVQARVAVAQGRPDEAIRIYRELLTPGPQQKWTAMLEPRYVLALARLLDKAGQRDAARVEYRRFLDYWKNADPDLPELKEARAHLG